MDLVREVSPETSVKADFGLLRDVARNFSNCKFALPSTEGAAMAIFNIPLYSPTMALFFAPGCT